MTKRFLLAAAAVAALPALAQAQPAPRPDPMGDATVARTDAEAKALAAFDAADADKDGFLSAEEMSAAMAARRPDGAPPRAPRPGEAPRGPRGMMDADKDGKVSKAEFTAGTLARFDRMDANHDGQLTKAERDDFMAEMMARRMAGMGGGDGPQQ